MHRLTTLVLLILLASCQVAARRSSRFTKHTFRPRDSATISHLDIYHPIVTYETYGTGVDHPLSKRGDVSYGDAAIAFIQSRLGADSETVQIHAAYEGSHADHVYVTQHHQGLPIVNAVANVALNKAGKVTAFGSSFVQTTQVASVTPSVAVEDAVANAEAALNGGYDEETFAPPRLVFIATPNNPHALTYALQVRNGTTGTWYDAFVDAHSGQLLSVTDFVAQATYRVLPITKQILTQGFENLVDPYDPVSSPLGWHNDGKVASTTTAGNNAIAFDVIQANVTVEGAPNLTFVFTQDPSLDPTVSSNLNAARVNIFYLVNMVHDIAYRYGFTESAFNFQTDNFGLGGRGNDRVDISVQAPNGFDNAQFTTLPDGVNGMMTMYIWDETDPRRDGALENDIIVHESTHGITNRMTGGGTAACLQTLEAGGLGEGWSDAMAEWTEHTDATIPDYVIGTYVTNNSAGIRTHPYSTNKTTNPLTYSSVATLDEVHKIGEVWANMLHNVYAALVGAFGFSQTAFTDPSGNEGNVVFLHLFLDALPIQPCNPTFVNARDAWLQADITRYNGSHKCTLWSAFASRGLGVNASNFTDDFTVPPGC